MKIERAIIPLVELARVGVHKRERRGVRLHGNPIDQVGRRLHDVLVSRHAIDHQRKLPLGGGRRTRHGRRHGGIDRQRARRVGCSQAVGDRHAIHARLVGRHVPHIQHRVRRRGQNL